MEGRKIGKGGRNRGKKGERGGMKGENEGREEGREEERVGRREAKVRIESDIKYVLETETSCEHNLTWEYFVREI